MTDATPPAAGSRTPLPLVPGEGEPRLRADAARNRARLLEAAARLAAEHGAANLTMDAVAAAASVGKGTVSRRFGDRTGLLLALLDHHERRLQEAFLAGPPPLGPGADPVQRLLAFGPAVVRHERAHLDMYLAAEPGRRRFTVPANQVRRTHVAVLLRQAGVGVDAELTAYALVGTLDTALVDHLLTERGFPPERLDAGWRDLVTRVVGTRRT
ncbi:TetR/AcrR family transcriptional regulator [Saccharothrix syringae]|uniref:TetR/AcrR family transcriptional regulator n=1 Tax=Saccharothrix syringae TaxID=103733 RepID=A0A5Q0H1S8_SACSY|nr:TetR/AcrR family transcriptional regulator [Saccharothrix syringae]